MLDRMRRHKGWLKWSLALVVLAFVLLYIPEFMTPTGANLNAAVASVDGNEITVDEFRRAYQRQIQQYRQAYGGNMDERLLKQLGIDQRIVQQLIEEEAALAEAKRLGITATDAEVTQRILALPAFQENGQFIGYDRYRQMLGMQEPPVREGEFEEQVRRSITVEKLQAALTSWITVSSQEAETEFKKRNEKVKLALVSFPVDKFRPTVQASDDEVAKWFEDHKSDYRIPEKRKIRYALVDVQAARERVQVSAQDVQRYYEDNEQQYSQPEQVRASHILLKTEGKDDAAVKKQMEEILAEFPEHTAAEIERPLEIATSAARTWRGTSIGERGSLMTNAAAFLRQHRDELAKLITAEMGKPISEAESEIEKCAWSCEFYAEHADPMLADEPAPSGATESYVTFDPLGPVLAIMPWNFPFWQVFRFAAPALMAGNVALLKHASNVPQCALAIERVFRESGFPQGGFQTLLIAPAAVDRLIEDPRIAAVTLTGSDTTGAKVAAASGRALKKTVLELGGSDAYIVLADADVDLAASTAVRARFINTGQSCIAAKRFIAVDAVADEFTERFTQAVARLVVGDPADRPTQIGPLARADLRDQLERQVRQSKTMGARVLVGGTRIEGRGYFFAPTVVDNVSREQPAYGEETFGPLAAIIRVPDESAAIEVANDTPYGLGASVWTRDVDRGRALAHRIDAGSGFVNGMVVSDPRLPFGGIKQSGYGRELSHFGLHEFVNVKTVWIGPQKA